MKIGDSLQSVLFDETAIARRLDELAAELTRVYRGKPLMVVPLLNGSHFFAADLVRRIALPLEMEGWRVSSYEGTTSSGNVHFHQEARPDVRGRHLLLLDDILDTGATLEAVCTRFTGAGALSVRTCVLLRKDVKRLRQVHADFVGFDIPDLFVVGYGLDHRGKYRNLPVIGVLHPDQMGDGAGAMEASLSPLP